jgi:hypothetical protein
LSAKSPPLQKPFQNLMTSRWTGSARILNRWCILAPANREHAFGIASATRVLLRVISQRSSSCVLETSLHHLGLISVLFLVCMRIQQAPKESRAAADVKIYKDRPSRSLGPQLAVTLATGDELQGDNRIPPAASPAQGVANMGVTASSISIRQYQRWCWPRERDLIQGPPRNNPRTVVVQRSS